VVYLVHLVCFVYLADLVRLVSFVQPNKRDKPNRPNKPERPNRPNEQDGLADFFSILINASCLVRRKEKLYVAVDVSSKWHSDEDGSWQPAGNWMEMSWPRGVGRLVGDGRDGRLRQNRGRLSI
jgi:hypothetical protein